MIEPEDYKFPHKEPVRQRTTEEDAKAAEILAYLESLPWRPIGVEW